MPCSAVTLSLATITSIIAVALLTIAFATDNWLYIDVKRANIQSYLSTHKDETTLLENLHSKYYYYSRTKGLFRICYPKERPPTVKTYLSPVETHLKTYLSPVETHCNNINYYIPDENNETSGFTDDAWTKLHMGRSMIALFIISFLAVFSAFCTGVTGCWRRSPGNITATAILMLLACLLSAGAMGLWHGVEYYEKEKVVGEDFYQEWSPILQENTEIVYDWSFVLGWLGVFSSLAGSFLFLFSSCCLAGEKEREEMNNVQYIMPVYPQKQQYAYAGYPVPAPGGYPGPYYTTSSGYAPLSSVP
ncbi:PMP-22/EMP/MP20/Claudin tight junction [Popillia japonica]|uniref:PMP-22/EMP/MP20/Claudin tight junction n=1 Tax=Popillia japonica TaxID=7064 RepID=A0AAW1KKL7_POPJA